MAATGRQGRILGITGNLNQTWANNSGNIDVTGSNLVVNVQAGETVKLIVTSFAAINESYWNLTLNVAGQVRGFLIFDKDGGTTLETINWLSNTPGGAHSTRFGFGTQEIMDSPGAGQFTYKLIGASTITAGAGSFSLVRGRFRVEVV